MCLSIFLYTHVYAYKEGGVVDLNYTSRDRGSSARRFIKKHLSFLPSAKLIFEIATNTMRRREAAKAYIMFCFNCPICYARLCAPPQRSRTHFEETVQ